MRITGIDGDTVEHRGGFDAIKLSEVDPGHHKANDMIVLLSHERYPDAGFTKHFRQFLLVEGRVFLARICELLIAAR